MNAPKYAVRRATVDDLGGLKQLWQRARLQVLDLEKRLTDFQLLSSDNADLIGAIGLHIEGKQGKLHSEAFAQPETDDRFRAQLWERIQSVARNHGLVRLWTQVSAPFWRQAGFADAPPELLEKLPPVFGDTPGHWLTLQLKEENAAVLSLDQEFELFQQAQKASNEKVMRQARLLNVLAYVIATVVFIAVLLGGFRLFQRMNQEKKPPATNQPAKP